MAMVHRLFLTVIMAALLLGFVPVHAQLLAVDQGDTLKKLVTSWGVNLSDWEANSDPCVGNWLHVTCDNVTKSQMKILAAVIFSAAENANHMALQVGGREKVD